MNETNKEVIIYGGAFNPPTLAHIAITKACIEYAKEQNAEIWLMPSGNRSDKTITTSRHQRLRYLDAMIADVAEPDVPIRVLTDELDRVDETETFDTVCQLAATYPNVNQTWVFGADSVATMHSWKEGDWLAHNLSMLVFKRLGSAATFAPAHNIHLVNVDTPPVSSTQVRAALRHGDDISELVGNHVRELLLQ